jgi:hypothetical protein
MRPKRSRGPLPPIRVRREPPTLEEAAAAALGLSDDLQQQVEIAAGLIGVPEDEVAPAVSAQRSAPRPSTSRGPPPPSTTRVVVLRRKAAVNTLQRA